MWALYLALEFSMPYNPDQFLQQNIIDQIEPELITFVGQSIILEAAQSVSIVLGLVAPYKIYKIIAGRF